MMASSVVAILFPNTTDAGHFKAKLERLQGRQLLKLEEALHSGVTDYQPSAVTAYLWDLAKTYSGFFQNCPVIRAETDTLKQSRLLLCDLTARVLKQCLCLLGIQTGVQINERTG